MTFIAETGNRPDYYLLHPPMQPKKEIADYVESCGIRVPQRFATLTDALSSGKPFMARSEHPQDYAGASGLGLSIFVRPEDFLEDKIIYYPISVSDWRKFLQSNHRPSIPNLIERLAVNMANMPQTEVEAGLTNLSSLDVNDYCQYGGYNTAEFRAGQSYSYWEGLAGFNRAIIADDTVPNRYFVFTSLFAPSKGIMWLQADGYQVIEDGRIVDERMYRLPTETSSDWNSLIDFYESVRGLDRFNPNHCALIEVQTHNGRHHFLQYLRVHDFHPVTFSLDRDKTDGEFETVLVQGATPPEGLDITLNIRHIPAALQKNEEAGYEDNTTIAFLEVVAPKRKLHLLGIEKYHNLLAAGGHLRRSALFKPEISVVVDDKSINELLGETFDRDNPVIKRKIHIVSDGRRAYLKRLG